MYSLYLHCEEFISKPKSSSLKDMRCRMPCSPNRQIHPGYKSLKECMNQMSGHNIAFEAYCPQNMSLRVGIPGIVTLRDMVGNMKRIEMTRASPAEKHQHPFTRAFHDTFLASL